MKEAGWDDLRLFYEVAREGGLSGAAMTTGVSAPTLGRRMQALERATGRSLFLRKPTGYELAPDGQVLFERVEAMREAAAAIDAWQQEVLKLPIVSIAADPWTARFIAGCVTDVWTPADSFRFCLKTTGAGSDLIYRNVDVAVACHRPEAGNLAARRIGRMAFAPYCSTAFDRTRHDNHVSLGTEHAVVRSGRWAAQQPGLWITGWTNAPDLLLELVRSGAGHGVLPCFVGDRDTGLVRTGSPITALEQQLWIATHNDGRRRPEVRTAIDRLSRLFTRNRGLFAGEGGDDDGARRRVRRAA